MRLWDLYDEVNGVTDLKAVLNRFLCLTYCSSVQCDPTKPVNPD